MKCRLCAQTDKLCIFCDENVFPCYNIANEGQLFSMDGADRNAPFATRKAAGGLKAVQTAEPRCPCGAMQLQRVP